MLFIWILVPFDEIASFFQEWTKLEHFENQNAPKKRGRQAATVTLTFYVLSFKSKINSSSGPNTHFGKFNQQCIFCILPNLFLQSNCSCRGSGCHWQNSIFIQILISITLQWYQSFSIIIFFYKHWRFILYACAACVHLNILMHQGLF